MQRCCMQAQLATDEKRGSPSFGRSTPCDLLFTFLRRYYYGDLFVTCEYWLHICSCICPLFLYLPTYITDGRHNFLFVSRPRSPLQSRPTASSSVGRKLRLLPCVVGNNLGGGHELARANRTSGSDAVPIARLGRRRVFGGRSLRRGLADAAGGDFGAAPRHRGAARAGHGGAAHGDRADPW